MGIPWMPWPLLWAVLQLGWRPGCLLETPDRPWNPLTFSPPQLTVAEGETATFTCSFSNTSEHFVLNLYRMSPSNQTVKLAAFPKDSGQVHRDPRFRVTWLPNGRDFEMSVLAAQRNDSGTYLCGVIYLPPETQIHESPHAELMVTERTLEAPTEAPSPPARPAGKLQGLVIGVTSVLVGILLLLLLTWVLTTTCPRATRGPCACCREDPPLVSFLPLLAMALGTLQERVRGQEALPHGRVSPQGLCSLWTMRSWTSSGRRRLRNPLPPLSPKRQSMPPLSSLADRALLAVGPQPTARRGPGL
ncbi:programmed cell death protein 1 isoform X3 [Desmodus rotundus]|uniref:programmed cell death protein 1 isoform X3 n=1 Tax=Desmodus rotundus TaxID=9430 RepID=UPI00238117DA|nr:programmed cell death protein 1 isoform X3 [Desmodus rotundus]